jgi:hypothetical protein
MLTRRDRHRQLGLSDPAREVRRPMMVVSSLGSFASAPGGRPRLPMLLRLWRCIVNLKPPDLLL